MKILAVALLLVTLAALASAGSYGAMLPYSAFGMHPFANSYMYGTYGGYPFTRRASASTTLWVLSVCEGCS